MAVCSLGHTCCWHWANLASSCPLIPQTLPTSGKALATGALTSEEDQQKIAECIFEWARELGAVSFAHWCLALGLSDSGAQLAMLADQEAHVGGVIDARVTRCDGLSRRSCMYSTQRCSTPWVALRELRYIDIQRSDYRHACLNVNTIVCQSSQVFLKSSASSDISREATAPTRPSNINNS